MIENNLTPRMKLSNLFWENRISLIIICLLMLNASMFIPNAGVLFAIIVAFVAVFIGKKEGSFKAIGFLKQDSWGRTIFIGAMYGIILQLCYSIFIDPI